MSPFNKIVQLLLAEPPGQQPYINKASASTEGNANTLTHANANFKKRKIY